MDFTSVAQLAFASITFFSTITLVIIPRKILNSNSRFERNYRLLDLTNYFSIGVFSATCFIVLLPHVLSSFMAAISVYQWTDALAYKTILSVAMAGFFMVFVLEKLGEYCQGGGGGRRTLHDPLADPLDKPLLHHHADNSDGPQGNKNSESYVVTFQDEYEDEEDDEEDDEINRDDDDNDEGRVGNILIKSNDDENDDDYDEDENAKLVSKPILINSSKGNNKNYNRNKKVTFKRNNKTKRNNNHNNGCQRLVVGGKQHNIPPSNNNFNIRCFSMLASLTTHSLFEGLSVGLMDSFWPSIHLSTSILFHQMLASVAVGVSLSRHRLSTTSFACSTVVFSASIPLGVILGMAVVYSRRMYGGGMGGNGIQVASSCLQALTVGTFLYVIFLEVLPSEADRHKDILLKLLLLILGFALVALLTFLLP